MTMPVAAFVIMGAVTAMAMTTAAVTTAAVTLVDVMITDVLISITVVAFFVCVMRFHWKYRSQDLIGNDDSGRDQRVLPAKVSTKS